MEDVKFLVDILLSSLHESSFVTLYSPTLICFKMLLMVPIIIVPVPLYCFHPNSSFPIPIVTSFLTSTILIVFQYFHYYINTLTLFIFFHIFFFPLMRRWRKVLVTLQIVLYVGENSRR